MTAPWDAPIAYEEWRDFLKRDFDNPTRRFCYNLIRALVRESGCKLRFAEVGFGQARDFSQCFKNLHDQGKIIYDGYDATRQFVDYVQRDLPDYRWHVGGFADLDEAFDIIYTRHTLEHIAPDNIEATIRHLLTACWGVAIICWFIEPQEHELVEFRDNQWRGKGAWVNTWGRDRIAGLIEGCGFDVEAHNQFPRQDAVWVCRRKAGL